MRVTPAHEILPAMTPYGELERLAAQVDVGNCTPSVQSRIREELELLMEGQEVEEQGFYAGFFNSGGLADYFMHGRTDALLVAYKPDEIADAAWEIQERGAPASGDEGRARGIASQFPFIAPVVERG